MKIRYLPVAVLLALGLAACTPAVTSRSGDTDTTRLTFGQSVDIANAGTRLSALRAQNGISRPMAHSARLQAAAQAHADDMARTGPVLSYRGQWIDAAHARPSGWLQCLFHGRKHRLWAKLHSNGLYRLDEFRRPPPEYVGRTGHAVRFRSRRDLLGSRARPELLKQGAGLADADPRQNQAQ